jgi:hypothetical protein
MGGTGMGGTGMGGTGMGGTGSASARRWVALAVPVLMRTKALVEAVAWPVPPAWSHIHDVRGAISVTCNRIRAPGRSGRPKATARRARSPSAWRAKRSAPPRASTNEFDMAKVRLASSSPKPRPPAQWRLPSAEFYRRCNPRILSVVRRLTSTAHRDELSDHPKSIAACLVAPLDVPPFFP